MHFVREAISRCTALVRKQAWLRQAETTQEGAGPLQLNLLAKGYDTHKVSAGPDAGGPVRASRGARSGLGRKAGHAEAAAAAARLEHRALGCGCSRSGPTAACVAQPGRSVQRWRAKSGFCPPGGLRTSPARRARHTMLIFA